MSKIIIFENSRSVYYWVTWHVLETGEVLEVRPVHGHALAAAEAEAGGWEAALGAAGPVVPLRGQAGEHLLGVGPAPHHVPQPNLVGGTVRDVNEPSRSFEVYYKL